MVDFICYDKEELQTIISHCRNLFKLSVAIYDTKNHLVAVDADWPLYNPKVDRTLNLQKRGGPDINLRDLEAGTFKYYSCRTGFAEAVAPIYIEGIFAATLLISNFRDSEQKFSSPEKVCKAAERAKRNPEDAMASLNNLSVLDEQGFADCLLILSNIISYSLTKDYCDACRKEAKNIFAYIEANLSRKFTIPDLCQKFDLLPWELNDLFKSYYDMTVRQFITTKRLEEAQRLLRETELSPQDIAESVGYLYPSLLQLFRKNFGTTPLEYRKSLKV